MFLIKSLISNVFLFFVSSHQRWSLFIVSESLCVLGKPEIMQSLFSWCSEAVNDLGWVPVGLWLETAPIYISGWWTACTFWSDSNYLWGLMMAWLAPWIQQLLQLLRGLWQGHSSREGVLCSTVGTDCDVLWKLMRVHLARQSESWFFVFVLFFFTLKNIFKDYMSSFPLLSPFLQAFWEADRGVKW